MSTPSIVSFVKGEERVSVYVHHDGYPSVRGVEIMEFLDIVSKQKEPFLGDVSITSARFVAYQYNQYFQWALSKGMDSNLLETMRVGIVNEKIENSSYIVDLGGDTPKATWISAGKAHPLEEVLHVDSIKMYDEQFA